MLNQPRSHMLCDLFPFVKNPNVLFRVSILSSIVYFIISTFL